MNQTAGLFGGLLIGVGILAAVIYVSPEARAWIAQKLTGAAAATSATGSAPAGAVTPPASSGGGLFGTFIKPLSAASAASPYQLQLTSAGVGLSTAAVTDTPQIPLPSIAQLAPTTPTLVYA